jgi:hypothetical protein
LSAFATAAKPIVDPGPTGSSKPSIRTIASPAGEPLSIVTSATSGNRFPEECFGGVARQWASDTTVMTGMPRRFAPSATSSTTPLTPLLEKTSIASAGPKLKLRRITSPNPSTRSNHIACRCPLAPTTCVWCVRESSTIGWKPGKLPWRGKSSSTGMRECPVPKQWTRPSAAMASAQMSAAAAMLPSWVASMRSRMARAAAR